MAETVRINGDDYAAPFACAYDPHSPDELATLTASVREYGVTDPVTTYDSPTHGRALLDGVTRVRLADELGTPVPVHHLGDLSDDAARDLLDGKHLGRRNLSAAEQERRRRERIDRARELKKAGKSLRQIAAETGVSKDTIRNDLNGDGHSNKPSGVYPSTPEPESECSTVQGADGKVYRQAPTPSWRKEPVEGNDGLDLTPGAAVVLKRLGIKTLGQLADRLDRGSLAELDPALQARLREAVADRRGYAVTPDADPEPESEEPEPDAPTDPDAFYKSRDTFAADVMGALRKLVAVQETVSSVFESPHAELARHAGLRHRMRWSPSGDETELANRLGVKVMLRLWSCDELTRLRDCLCELRAWLLKPDAGPDAAPPWEG